VRACSRARVLACMYITVGEVANALSTIRLIGSVRAQLSVCAIAGCTYNVRTSGSLSQKYFFYPVRPELFLPPRNLFPLFHAELRIELRVILLEYL
jgi:hypothetical protein